MAGIRPLRSDEKHQSAPLDRVSPPLQIQRGRSAGARPPLRDGVKSDRPRGSVVAPEKNFQYEVFVLAILDQKDTLRRTRTKSRERGSESISVVFPMNGSQMYIRFSLSSSSSTS